VRHRSRPLLVLAALSAGLLPAAAPHPGGGAVRVEITGLRSDKGTVRACMTQRRERFPDCRGGLDRALAVPARGAVTLEFADVAAGTYAIAVLHDENGNGKMDRAMMLMPREGYGFSRDAPVVMGPPTFAQAAFQVAATPVRQTIHIRYML